MESFELPPLHGIVIGKRGWAADASLGDSRAYLPALLVEVSSSQRIRSTANGPWDTCARRSLAHELASLGSRYQHAWGIALARGHHVKGDFAVVMKANVWIVRLCHSDSKVWSTGRD